MTLEGCTILVTGASRGLGREMAFALAAGGARVAAAARTFSDPVLKASWLDASIRGELLPIAADVRNPGSVAAMMERTLERFGHLDVLVNNAGLMIGDMTLPETSSKLWQEVLDTNLTGAFRCCQEAIPHMLRQGHGVIVNITSGAAVRAGFLNVPYGVSKAGLDRLTLGIAHELRDQGLACVSLSPPVSATDSVRAMYPSRDVDAFAQAPELTAQAIVALLENDPMRYSGQVLSVKELLDRNVGHAP